MFTYFHFASGPELYAAMKDSGATCIAYECVEKADGSLPLLVSLPGSIGVGRAPKACCWPWPPRWDAAEHHIGSVVKTRLHAGANAPCCCALPRPHPFPLLQVPMSEVAGCLSVQAGEAALLQPISALGTTRSVGICHHAGSRLA